MVQRAATHIAKKAVEMDIVPGRSPISVAAAAIYMASQVCWLTYLSDMLIIILSYRPPSTSAAKRKLATLLASPMSPYDNLTSLCIHTPPSCSPRTSNLPHRLISCLKCKAKVLGNLSKNEFCKTQEDFTQGTPHSNKCFLIICIRLIILIFFCYIANHSFNLKQKIKQKNYSIFLTFSFLKTKPFFWFSHSLITIWAFTAKNVIQLYCKKRKQYILIIYIYVSLVSFYFQ